MFNLDISLFLILNIDLGSWLFNDLLFNLFICLVFIWNLFEILDIKNLVYAFDLDVIVTVQAYQLIDYFSFLIVEVFESIFDVIILFFAEELRKGWMVNDILKV